MSLRKVESRVGSLVLALVFGLPLTLVFALGAAARTAWSAPVPASIDLDRLEILRAGEDVLGLAQGPDGYLWLGTPTGLYRYDGRTLAAAQPALQRNVVALAADPDGRLWVGTEAPVEVLLLRPGAARPDAVFSGERLPLRRVRSLATAGPGQVWAGGNGGLVRLGTDGAVTRLLETSAQVLALALESGRLLVSVAEGTDRAQGEASGRRGAGASRLLTLDPRTGAQAPGVELRGLERRAVAIAGDAAGGLWLGTGAGLLNAVGQAELLLPGRSIHALLRDREGNLWLGTAQGLVRAPTRHPVLVLAPERGEAVSVLPSRAGSVLILSDPDTLLGFEGDRLTEELKVHAPGGLIGLVEGPAGIVWAGSWQDGLFRRPRAGAFERAPLPGWSAGDTLRPLLHSARHGLVLGVGAGQVATEGERDPRWQDLRRLGIDSEVLAGAEDASGVLWLASEGHGLVRLAGEATTRIGKGEGLPSERLTALLARPDGDLWIGTRDAGLVIGHGERFVAFDRARGLGTDSVAGLVADGKGHVWITTPGDGVIRVREADVAAAARGATGGLARLRLTTADGLGSDGAPLRSAPAGGIDGAGRLWLASLRGAHLIADPGAPARAPLPPPIVESAHLDGKDLPLGESPTRRVDAGVLQIRYTAAVFQGRDRVRFRHRLAGPTSGSPPWRDAGDAQEAEYAGLGPGTYRFEVMSYDSGAPELAPVGTASVPFVLVPPLHRTGAFQGALGVLVAALVLLIWRVRLRGARQRQVAIDEDRRRIAREIHDSLEQTLYAVKLQLEAANAKLLPIPAPEPRENLATGLELVERGMAETRAAVWALRTGAIGAADLAVAIAVTAGEALRGTKIAFALTTIGDVYRLPAVTEWHVGQCVREACTNALKHANPSRLEVRLAFEPTHLEIDVRDDGPGMTLSAGRPETHGLLGMRERLRTCGGSVTLESVPGQGTTVRLRIPRGSVA